MTAVPEASAALATWAYLLHAAQARHEGTMVILTVCAALVIGAALVLFVPGSPVRLRSSIGAVHNGEFATALSASRTLGLLKADEPTAGEEPGHSRTRPAPEPRGDEHSRHVMRGHERSAVIDGMIPSTLSATMSIADWLRPDEQVIEALRRLTHQHIESTFDIWDTVHARDYNLMSPGWVIKMRGHVGEQEVIDQLHPWLGERVHLWPDSNHPGSDLTIDGHEFNVKVSADYANVGPEHFAANPDIPIIINSDAAHLPADAFHIDLSQPFDPSLLDGHAVVVADGLSLSGIQDALGDQFGELLGGNLDFADIMGAAHDMGIPVLGSAIRLVRSGIREGKLLGVHHDPIRTAKNIVIDVGVVGSGVVVGGEVGHWIGAAADVSGYGFGLGAPVGRAIGMFVGGFVGSNAAKNLRLKPLADAQSAATDALSTYDMTFEQVEIEIAESWNHELRRIGDLTDEAKRRLVARAEDVYDHLDSNLRAGVLGDIESVSDRLQSASLRVDQAVRTEHNLLSTVRARSWRRAASAATDQETMFDVLIAAPGGRAEVETLIADVSARREAAWAVAAEANRIIHAEAACVRAEAAAEADRVRHELQQLARDRLDSPMLAVSAANDLIRQELVKAGLTTTASEPAAPTSDSIE